MTTDPPLLTPYDQVKPIIDPVVINGLLARLIGASGAVIITVLLFPYEITDVDEFPLILIAIICT